MEKHNNSFVQFFWRVSATHMISYFFMGVLASTMLDYKEVFDNSSYFRPYDSPWIAAGPMLQVIRGLVFALALWFFKESFLIQKFGWLKLWGLVVGLSILSTCAAATGSIEGFIYTKIPWSDQAMGYFEIVPQTGLFAFLLCAWYNSPKRIWNILAIISVSLICLMSLMGTLAALGIIAVS